MPDRKTASLSQKPDTIKASANNMLYAINNGFNDKKLLKVPCPHCRTKGKFKPHGFYWRNLIRWDMYCPLETKAKIFRVRCTSCKTTHALLPSNIIAYSPYSLEFCAALLAEKIKATQTIEVICKKFCVYRRIVYRVAYFYEQVASILGFAQSRADIALMLCEISSSISALEKFTEKSLRLTGRPPFTRATLPNVTNQHQRAESGFT